jgi:UDP-N-acetyl-D-glucosamine dehydrogenase
MTNDLVKRIEAREACVGVVGLGYVGLPLLLEFCRQGFPTLGLDIDETKVAALKAGTSYIRHIDADRIRTAFRENEPAAQATTDFTRVPECDALLLCVPTPLSEHQTPDLTYIESTAERIGPHLRRGQLVCLESTTYPGTTEDVLIPILESASGLRAGTDFLVAYSPEREDPNNTKFATATIPKVVGGLNEASLTVARALYDSVICETVPVPDCRTAEATKLMENIFRCVNIALVNELKMVFSRMGIDVWEVVRAASTKPFGFMPFYPGPGLGGHCIPIDPFYLTWKAKEYGAATRFIELAGEINTSMPDYVIHQTLLALNTQRKSLNGSRVLLVGLAYKKNVDDDRESPTYVLWEKLLEHGAEVAYYDPYCPVVRPTREHPQFAGIASVDWDDITAERFDLAVIATAHDCVDHTALADRLPLVIDTRGTCPPHPRVVKA